MPENTNLNSSTKQEIESFNQELAESINQNLSNSFTNLESIQLIKFSLAIIALIVILKVGHWLIKKIQTFLFKQDKVFGSIKYKNLVLIESNSIHKFINFVFGILQIISALFIFSSFLTYVLSIFPKTQGIADTLLRYIGQMAFSFLRASLNFIPNLLTITFIILITYYSLQFIKFIARGLFSQKISFSGFKREWIIPTYKITQFFIVIFAIIAIFPYLPGSGSPAFQGVSVFVGLLITLGSSTAIANTIAGLVLIYMSPYNVGDRVKIDNIVGDITEIGVLVTRLRTIKNEDVTIPNSKILSQETINYTNSTKSQKNLLTFIEISIGYDVAHQKVEETLLNSVTEIAGLSKDITPFVLIKELANNYIIYELNVSVSDAQQILPIKSELNKNILDNCKKANIEILSPSFHSLRQQKTES